MVNQPDSPDELLPLEGDDDDIEEQVMVTRAPVNRGDRPKALKAGSYSESSHMSLGDISLMSQASFHSATHRDDDGDDIFETSTIGGPQRIWCKHARLYFWYHPVVHAVRRRYKRIPTRYKYMCFVLWVSWKFVAAFLLVYLVQSSSSSSSSAANGEGVLRILYMVTAPHVQQQHQSASTATPLWIESVHGLVNQGRHHVDVVFILGDDSVDTTLETIWRQLLPPSTTLTVWANAIPWKNEDGRLVPDAAALALQHRLVVKDQWFNYHVFLQWDTNTRIKATHVDYFWQQSQILSPAPAGSGSTTTIPGFFGVGRVPGNQTQSSGPFRAQVCCDVLETNNYMVRDATFLLKATSIQRRQDDAQMVLLPVSSKHLNGWMMTQQQVLKVLQGCPSFLPTVDDGSGHCSWKSWINLDPEVFSNHFVEQFANVAASSNSLSPNRLWKELGQKDVIQ